MAKGGKKDKMGEEKDNFEYRNTHPHMEAEMARIFYAKDYSSQDGGTMDFWDSLSSKRKEYCVCLVDELLKLPRCKEEEG